MTKQLKDITSAEVFIEFLGDMEAAARKEWQKQQEERREHGRPLAPDWLSPASFICGMRGHIERQQFLNESLTATWETFAQLLIAGWSEYR